MSFVVVLAEAADDALPALELSDITMFLSFFEPHDRSTVCQADQSTLLSTRINQKLNQPGGQGLGPTPETPI